MNKTLLPVTVTTRILIFVVRDPYKQPSFTTLNGWGVDATDATYVTSLYVNPSVCSFQEEKEKTSSPRKTNNLSKKSKKKNEVLKS